ncbi:YrhC family protein [Aeribacillus alveayuensis]|uniref:YrhC-like protein n=1 Tax=Aeribacillus alveayuensis TaxID=279215 RepID=A0ABT9VJY3_9BACI|nr:hypothetical protein [Bacillus alveayuensis]
MEKKKLYDLMLDFKRYAMILLAISTFLYIGLFIPEGYVVLTTKEQLGLLSVTSVLLFSSLFCFWLSLKYRHQLDDLDE